VEPQGPKLAEGRDSEIFEHGPGRVLRRARDGRSLVREADVMRHVRAHGYPAPEVFDAGEGWLVMERLEGRDMLAAAGKSPRRLRTAVQRLAELHRALGVIPAPEWLDAAPGPAGDRVVHLDLHPLNVMSTPNGLVVIDWANARRGDPAIDIANTWSLLACGEAPGGRLERSLVALVRGLLLRTFLAATDRAAAERVMPALVEWRVQDRNHTETERQRLRRLLR
jgi:aminoglycoside phosphotransferase (APT) family kinase protein